MARQGQTSAHSGTGTLCPQVSVNEAQGACHRVCITANASANFSAEYLALSGHVTQMGQSPRASLALTR